MNTRHPLLVFFSVFTLIFLGASNVANAVPPWFWDAFFEFAEELRERTDAAEAAAAAAQIDAAAAQAEAAAATAAVASIAAELDALKAANEAVNELTSYLKVDTSDPAKPVIRIVGANLQIVNGLGGGNGVNGVGNLLVGYDATRPSGTADCGDGTISDQATCIGAGFSWDVNHKSGSHNVVVGPGHNYSRDGGLVAGSNNTVSADHATVSAGYGNVAANIHSGISGGTENIASGPDASVSGGWLNNASQPASSVSGGHHNSAAGWYSSVSGGTGNTASGNSTSVSGGQSRAAPGTYDWAAGALHEDQ